LFQTALRVLGNTEDAEDALQDGMLSAYRNLKRFEGRSQFSTWLTRIVINAALMRRRSAKARPAVSLDESPREDELPAAERYADDGPNPEQVFASTEIREIISENLTNFRLTATAFVLREVQGSDGRGREEAGVTENTLKARLWRARHQMAERLGRRLRRMKDGISNAGGMGDAECSYC
jgi:RNA polymerase sigma-70 factor (ECF subfamily)